MELLAQIPVPVADHEAIIQLFHGDLSALPPEHAVDVMIVSAFPNNYEPIPGTLVAAIANKGVSWEELASNKASDMRMQLGCWLSEEMPSYLQQILNSKRILCFEPRTLSNKPEQVVSNIFRCLNNFIIPDVETKETWTTRQSLHIHKIAMPMLATGNQKASVELMLPAILTASAFWLQQGLPLTEIKLVVYNIRDVNASVGIFNWFANQLLQQQSLPQQVSQAMPAIEPMPVRSWKEKMADRLGEIIDEKLFEYLLGDMYAVATEEEKNVIDKLVARMEAAELMNKQSDTANTAVMNQQFDYFISYAHKNSKEVLELVNALQQKNNSLSIFYDRNNIPPGGLWIKKISTAIQQSKNVVCILSPQYSDSDVCWDEFQCAKLKEYNTKQPVIKTIALYKDVALPPIMGIYSYIDCTEGDLQKLKDAADILLQV